MNPASFTTLPHNPPPSTDGVAPTTTEPVIHASPLQTLHSTDHEFTSLLRIIEDFAHRRHPYRKPFAPFVPRFDLEEHADTYELYGDFPGVKKEDIHVSVVDNGRIEIRGLIRHIYTNIGKEVEDPSHNMAVEGMEGAKQKIADAAQAIVGNQSAASASTSRHAVPRIEERTAAADAEAHSQQLHKVDKHGNRIKEIIKERQEGEFHRIFHFPQPVELGNGVVARMNNGVLHVTIARGPAPAAKKVDIGWVPYYGL